jgi:hypothetical protein
MCKGEKIEIQKGEILGMLELTPETPRVSSDEFIEDTTSSFLCIPYRSGDSQQLSDMQDLLEKFERASGKDVSEKLKAIRNLNVKARELEVRGSSDKLKLACKKILKNGLELEDRFNEEVKKGEEEEKEKEEKKAVEEKKKRRIELEEMGPEGRIMAFEKKYGGALLKTLLDGTEEKKGDAKVLKLTQNFNNIGFTYSMKYSPCTDLLGGSCSGDCHTLSDAMSAICEDIFLMDTTIGEHKDLLVASSEKTIDKGKAPNGAGGTFWVFENHFWVVVNGKAYDPLFGGPLSRDGWHARVGEKEFKDLGISIEDYGGEYKIVSLMTSGGKLTHKLINEVTEQEWEINKEEANKIRADRKAELITDTFEQMKKKVLG